MPYFRSKMTRTLNAISSYVEFFGADMFLQLRSVYGTSFSINSVTFSAILVISYMDNTYSFR